MLAGSKKAVYREKHRRVPLAQVLENGRGPLSQRNPSDKSPGLTKQYRQQLRVANTVPMRLQRSGMAQTPGNAAAETSRSMSSG